jgi:hypothetical protein
MAQRGDVGQDAAADIVQRRDDRGGVADAGDHELDPMRDQRAHIGIAPRVGRVHQDVGTKRRTAAAALLLGVPDAPFHLDEPRLELFDGAAIHRRKGADNAGPAGRDHEVRPRHQEHRRRDQRQRQAIGEILRQGHCPLPSAS